MKIWANGIELFYEQSGAGAPLILLHGNGEDHHIFDPLTRQLRRKFTVYALDSRNHGESTKTGDYAYETMAEDVFSFIQELQLEKVNVVGFSDGAIISLILAMEHGEVLAKMALLGVNLTPDDFTEENYREIQKIYEETKDPLYKLMLEEPHIELEELGSVTIPTLLIAGEEDLFKPECLDQLLAALPDARRMVMKGHNHDSYVVNQDLLYADFVHFFTT